MSNVVVIGGGVIGLACAYRLARQGATVTVLDRHHPGSGASAGNAGWIAPSLAAPLPGPGVIQESLRWIVNRDSPLRVVPWADRGLLPWLWRFSRFCTEPAHRAGLRAIARLSHGTMAYFDELRADGVEFEMQHSGLLFAFSSAQSLEHGWSQFSAQHEFGYAVPVVLDAREIRSLEPALTDAVIGGFLVDGERLVRPEALVAGLVKRLLDLGVSLESGVEVRALRRDCSRITHAVTNGGRVAGDQFLLAAGSWSGALGRSAGLSLPIQAGKGYSITVHEPSVRLRYPLYLGDARVVLSPFTNTLRVAGTLELSGLNTQVTRSHIESIKRVADRHVAGWRVGASEDLWAGLRPLAPDGLPVIGRAPHFSNLFVATGHGMLGVTLAPTTAVHIADVMCTGCDDATLAPFDPQRFLFGDCYPSLSGSTHQIRAKDAIRACSNTPSPNQHSGETYEHVSR